MENKNNYPNDEQFTDLEISEVSGDKEHGWQITYSDSWCFWVPPDSPVEPKVGMTARQYGKGLGSPVRGLYLDGQCIYYRTEDEHKEYFENEFYGKDAADWLERWDSGKSVWSIEMGGLGPGYEQAIQITAAEILRIILAHRFDASKWAEDADVWKVDRDVIESEADKTDAISKLGLSGAQFGVATHLATALYMDGPRTIMSRPEIQDRKIQVSKNFPGATR